MRTLTTKTDDWVEVYVARADIRNELVLTRSLVFALRQQLEIYSALDDEARSILRELQDSLTRIHRGETEQWEEE